MKTPHLRNSLPGLYRIVLLILHSLWSGGCEGQTLIASDPSETQLTMDPSEAFNLSPNNLYDVANLITSLNHSFVRTEFPKYAKGGSDSLQLVQGIRNGNLVDYFLLRGSNFNLARIGTDSNGNLTLTETVIKNISTVGAPTPPICSSLLNIGDRIYILCKEVQTSAPTDFKVKLFSFTKTDYFKTDDYILELTSFVYQSTADRRLDGTYCTYKDGVTTVEYLAIYEISESPGASTDYFFIFTLIDRKFKNFSVNVRTQVVPTYLKLMTLGCNFNSLDGSRYLFLTHSDRANTYIVPVSDGLIRLYFGTAGYVPGSMPSQYFFGQGLLAHSKELVPGSNRLLVFQQYNGIYRYYRTLLNYIPLDSATEKSQFLADLDGSKNIEITRLTNPMDSNFNTYRFVEQIQSVLFLMELRTNDTVYPRVVDVFVNDDMQGGYKQTNRLISAHETLLVTIKLNSQFKFDPEYLLTTVTVRPPAAPSTVFILRAYSMDSLSLSVNIQALTSFTNISSLEV